MYRRSLFRLLPLAEAKKLFLSADGKPLASPTASLSTVLEAIQTNYRVTPMTASTPQPVMSPQECEVLVAAGMNHVVQLDQGNADSELLAAWREENPRNDLAAGGGLTDDGTAPTQVHTVVQVMRAFPNHVAIRECCARCLANMCQLSPIPDGLNRPAVDGDATEASNANVAYYKALDASFAEQLVKEGAVELALGTMSSMHRLSRRGRCWAALAVLNLVCLSRTGASRAAAAKGEEVLAEFVLFLLEENMSAGVLVDEDGLTGIALDAALGALTGVLAAEAPENDKGYSYNYEKVGYTAVDALVRSLLATSALLVRDGRNDGAYNASLPARRYGGTLTLPKASARQQAAVATLLPPLHKGWLALQQATSHTDNLPMVFDALYEAANTNQESGGRVADGDDVHDTDGDATEPPSAGQDVLKVSAQTERRYVAALTNMLEAGLFVVTELEAVAEASPELAQLQRDLSLAVMDVMATLTATRKDMRGGPAAAAARSMKKEGVIQADRAEEEDDDEAGLSAILPTPAAAGVTGVLASGLVSSMALATAVRLHTDQQAHIDDLKQRARGVGAAGAPELVPYRTEAFTLLSKSLMVLIHLSETEDEVAASANTVAALQAMLRDAVEVTKSFPFYYQGDITALFKPTDVQASEEGIGAGRAERPIQPAHRLALMQHLALVGQMYAVLYAVLRTPAGVSVVAELEVPATAAEMQTALEHAYGKAIQEARRRYGGSAAGGDAQADGAATSTKWVPNAAEESVVRLTRLGGELISTLSTLSNTGKAPQK